MPTSTPGTRRSFLVKSLCLPLAAGGLAQNIASAQQSDKYGILGRPAPELEVDYWIDKNGEPTSFQLADAKDKFVYLYCFQNWCPGCHSHGFPTLKKIADAFADEDGVVAVGVQTTFEGYASNTQDKVRELQIRYELPVTLGHDEGDPETHEPPKTMRSYRTGGTPWAIIIDPSRTVIFNGFHPDGDRVIEYFRQQLA